MESQVAWVRQVWCVALALALVLSGCNVFRSNEGSPLVPEGSEVVTAVTSAGGTVVSKDGSASVTFEPGTVVGKVKVEVSSMAELLSPLQTGVPLAMRARVEVQHSRALPGGTVRVAYDPAVVAPGSLVRVGVEEPDGWLLVDTVADATSRILTAEVPHFSEVGWFSSIVVDATDAAGTAVRLVQKSLVGAPNDAQCDPEMPGVTVRSGKGQVVPALDGCAYPAADNFDVKVKNRYNFAFSMDTPPGTNEVIGTNLLDQGDFIDILIQAGASLFYTYIPAGGGATLRVARDAPLHIRQEASLDLVNTTVRAVMLATVVASAGKGAAGRALDPVDSDLVNGVARAVGDARSRGEAPIPSRVIEAMQRDREMARRIADDPKVRLAVTYLLLFSDLAECATQTVTSVYQVSRGELVKPTASNLTKVRTVAGKLGKCLALFAEDYIDALGPLLGDGALTTVDILVGILEGVVKDVLGTATAVIGSATAQTITEVRIDRVGVVTHPTCDRATIERPVTFHLDCDTQPTVVEDVRWSEWNERAGVGRGFLRTTVDLVNVTVPVELRLSDPAVNGNGDTYFKTIEVGDAAGSPRLLANVNTKGSRTLRGLAAGLVTPVITPGCDSNITVAPRELTLYCDGEPGDFAGAAGIEWSSWGTLSAVGRGRAVNISNTGEGNGVPLDVQLVGRTSLPGSAPGYFAYLLLSSGTKFCRALGEAQYCSSWTAYRLPTSSSGRRDGSYCVDTGDHEATARACRVTPDQAEALAYLELAE
jgi:hypothetical protein